MAMAACCLHQTVQDNEEEGNEWIVVGPGGCASGTGAASLPPPSTPSALSLTDNREDNGVNDKYAKEGRAQKGSERYAGV
jgi:hypothetical protein